MRVMFVGDVFGRSGREAVLGLVPMLKKSRNIDVVVVNCENAAGGRGITPPLADAFLAGGIDVLTSGNHIWHFSEINAYLEAQPRLIRPANYANAPGRGAYRHKLKDGRTLGVMQVEGRVFMRSLLCPFATASQQVDALGKLDGVLVDVHAEATSEKQALAWHLDGRVSAVIGTHTHVQTADERILPLGTALLTDAGMSGPHDSVIGMAPDKAIERFLQRQRGSPQVATGNVLMCGAIVTIDTSGGAGHGRATAIERLRETWPQA